MMGVIEVKRDGPVRLSELNSILTSMDKEYTAAFEEILAALERAQSRIKKLEAALDTERRLRLGRRK